MFPKEGELLYLVKSRYVQGIALSGKHGMEESLEVDFQTSSFAGTLAVQTGKNFFSHFHARESHRPPQSRLPTKAPRPG